MLIFKHQQHLVRLFFKSNRLLFVFLLCSSIVYAQSDSLHRLKVQLVLHPEDDSIRVQLLNSVSHLYQYENFYQSIEYAEQALKIAQTIHYPKGIATSYYRISICLWALGFHESSIDKALLAIQLSEKDQLTNELSESYRVLAMNYRDQQSIEKASYYIQESERLALTLKNWDLLSRIYNTYGLIESDKKNHEISLQLFRKALRITQEHSTYPFHVCQILSNIGEYHLQHNADTALAYFSKALAKARESGNRLAEAGITCDIGRTLTRKKKYKEADDYLHRGLALSYRLGLKRVTRHAYNALVELKTQEGKLAESFTYLKSYYDIRDSLLNATKTRQIVELEARYANEKIDQKIRILEKEKQMEAMWRNFLLVGSLFLLISIVVIYRLQQLRSKKTKQLLATQEKLTAQLQETDALKSRFFANISHEFRTPLSLIIAPIEDKINSPGISDPEKEELKLVRRNAYRLLDLINQLLDLSKLEAGKMKLTPREVNLDSFFTEIISSFNTLAENKGIIFFKNIIHSAKAIWMDPDKVEMIISNVLFNAFKFTPKGGAVTMTAYITIDQEQLRIKITDTGIGIAKEDQLHLFTPFYQAKNSSDDSQLGTGLGLSLVNELVKLHQGEISISSKMNEGTTVDITLPVLTAGQPSENANRINTHSNLNKLEEITDQEEVTATHEEYEDSILVIEDNPDVRNYVTSCFKNEYTVYTAKNGQEGMTSALLHIPTIIISDIMMPISDGMDLTAKIKSDERTSHIPVVLLTAKVDSASRLTGLKLGADDYLVKPFSTEELKVRISNLIDQRKKLIAKFRLQLEVPPPTPKDLSLDERFLMRAKEVVMSNLNNAQFGVELLADQMHLSRAQLFRKFKALIEISPSEFISDLRLQRAAELIIAKADTLSQISYQVGFNEYSYFAKRFRKKFGLSPSEYAVGEDQPSH